MRTQRGSWLPRLSGCGDRAPGRVSVAGGSVHTSSGQPPPLARCASWEVPLHTSCGSPGPQRVSGAGWRPGSEPPPRSPAPPRPRPAPRLPAALGVGRAEPEAHGVARAGRRSQAGVPAPSPSVRRPSGAFPFYLPSLPGPVAALPPSPPSRPLQPLLPGSYRPPRCPRSYGQTHRHLQVGESPRAGRGRARRRCARGRESLCVGGGRTGVRAASPPLGGLAVTRLNPPFVPLGFRLGGARRPRVRAESRAAGRRRRRPRGREGVETPGGRASGGRGSGLSLWGRPAAQRLLSPPRQRARCVGLARPLPLWDLLEVGRRAGNGKEKMCSLSFQVLRRLWRERERGVSGLCQTCFPPARHAKVRLGRV